MMKAQLTSLFTVSEGGLELLSPGRVYCLVRELNT
jgi:hypothetical protein